MPSANYYDFWFFPDDVFHLSCWNWISNSSLNRPIQIFLNRIQTIPNHIRTIYPSPQPLARPKGTRVILLSTPNHSADGRLYKSASIRVPGYDGSDVYLSIRRSDRQSVETHRDPFARELDEGGAVVCLVFIEILMSTEPSKKGQALFGASLNCMLPRLTLHFLSKLATLPTCNETSKVNRIQLASIARGPPHQNLFIINPWRYVGFYGETVAHLKLVEKTSSIVKCGINFNSTQSKLLPTGVSSFKFAFRK